MNSFLEPWTEARMSKTRNDKIRVHRSHLFFVFSLFARVAVGRSSFCTYLVHCYISPRHRDCLLEARLEQFVIAK